MEEPVQPRSPRPHATGLGHILFAAVLLLVLSGSMVALSISGDYGWTMFVTIPFSIGLTLGFFAARNVGLLGKFFLGFLILTGLMGIMLLSGAEGVICILMALGLIVLPFFLGVLLGYWIWKSNLKNKTPAFAFLMLLNPLSFISDQYLIAPFEATATSHMIINAPAEDIWKALTTEVRYQESGNFFLKSGVTYPTYMRFEQKNGRQCLNCFLTNDTATLWIHELRENELLSFSPDVMPVAMKELTFYNHLDAPHLRNYFIVKKGSFRIRKMDNSTCEVIASTDYTYNIAPSFYWILWTDYIADKIHMNVLESLKKKVEKTPG